ncbi:EamA family transporter RarD [Grimontia hollisae]|uniref:Protein rarD n=1 Tax=Grimontia hollisae CIP 101886 TaxID=675812 RepID=D0I344_GRIHO|nr:EamA family transporter RarD [Grimontia hollisae]AMG30693.1 EamA family transporter RarD [Grimontia hollisae]EEY74086.1 protein rarD [Grimontia hollisae CIP 101886]STO47616.1 putative chloramphenical resistance permease RarD [Grimontia hollisae]
MNDAQQTRRGVLLALGAYTMWGVAPLYFKALTNVPPLEVLMHRVLWSFFFLALIIHASGGLARVKLLLKDKKRLGLLTLTALVIATNWLIFIWAVNNDRMLDASLGYYINPLINVVLGMVFLGERFRKLQWVAVALAFSGVAIQVITFGSLPWVALVLACSFGSYGLLRKKINIDAATGLFIETLVLLPVALVYLLFIANSATSDMMQNSLGLNLLLVAAGIVTTLPLLCFNGAATKLRLSTLGFFQYIGPSIMFMLAVGLYSEPFTADKATTFAFIWMALAIFTFDAVRQRNKQRRQP